MGRQEGPKMAVPLTPFRSPIPGSRKRDRASRISKTASQSPRRTSCSRARGSADLKGSRVSICVLILFGEALAAEHRGSPAALPSRRLFAGRIRAVRAGGSSPYCSSRQRANGTGRARRCRSDAQRVAGTSRLCNRRSGILQQCGCRSQGSRLSRAKSPPTVRGARAGPAVRKGQEPQRR
jgi:hypothetical protein